MKLNMEVFFAVNVCRMNYDGTIINPSKLLNRDMTRTGVIFTKWRGSLSFGSLEQVPTYFIKCCKRVFYEVCDIF